MSKLECRTLTHDSPQGKQKVYLCFHPDDFGTYLDAVCDDLFRAFPGCAIYYDSDTEGAYERDDLLLQLSCMQLFVVVVTRRTLEEPSRVMALDIPFALGRASFALSPEADAPRRTCHIPVLPITFESDLYRLFNEQEIFKGMQYLKRYETDDTELGFEEKLRRYLEAVLVSDEEKKRIQREFIARIFLSYRKADRALAQKLMEQIHGVDFCRDVAIWYDEYLIPGESWKQSVMDELSGSDLFLLNVTNTLLAKGNFVFKEEYPAAKRSGRPILPAETEQTDRELLEEMYEGTKETTVSAEDRESLERGLKDKLVGEAGKNELLRENNDPAHIYYIGLAYKNNVEVEPNAQRAVDLMERAGQGGYRDAFYTLGQMYEKGDGVARDDEKAIAYYRDFIERQKPDFGTSKDGDYRLLLAYDAIGMIYIRRSELGRAFTLYEELTSLLDGMTSCYGSFQTINLPAGYERLGAIKKQMGDFPAAQAYYEKAMYERRHPRTVRNIATDEDRQTETVPPSRYNEEHMKFGTAVNLYSQGEIAERNRDLDGAKEKYTRAREIFRELSETVNDPDVQINLAKSTMKLGTVADTEGKQEEALRCFLAARETAGDAAKNKLSFAAQEVLILSLISLGTGYRNRGELSRARQCLEEALETAEQAAKTAGGSRTDDLLSVIYEKRGILAEMTQDWEEAKESFAKFLALSRQAAKGKEEEPELQRNLSIACEKMGHVCRKLGDTASALQYLREDEQICEKLAQNADDIQAQRDLSVCYDAIAGLCEETGAYEEALKYHVRGLALARALAERHEGISEADDLATSYYRIGLLCEGVSRACLQCAVKNWRMLYAKTMNPAFGEKVDLALSQLREPDRSCPIPKGFTGGMDELIDRYASDLTAEGQFAYMPPEGTSHSGQWIWRLLLAAIVIGVTLQLTGAVDIAGWLRGLF